MMSRSEGTGAVFIYLWNANTPYVFVKSMFFTLNRAALQLNMLLVSSMSCTLNRLTLQLNML